MHNASIEFGGGYMSQGRFSPIPTRDAVISRAREIAPPHHEIATTESSRPLITVNESFSDSAEIGGSPQPARENKFSDCDVVGDINGTSASFAAVGIVSFTSKPDRGRSPGNRIGLAEHSATDTGFRTAICERGVPTLDAGGTAATALAALTARRHTLLAAEYARAGDLARALVERQRAIAAMGEV